MRQDLPGSPCPGSDQVGLETIQDGLALPWKSTKTMASLWMRGVLYDEGWMLFPGPARGWTWWAFRPRLRGWTPVFSSVCYFAPCV